MMNIPDFCVIMMYVDDDVNVCVCGFFMWLFFSSSFSMVFFLFSFPLLHLIRK